MNVTLLTCTGDRPAAFALCEAYMARQTVPYTQWLVLDDGEVPTVCTRGQEYIYCPQYKGRESLANKVRHCFTNNLVAGEAVAFIEDDDWYDRRYLDVMTFMLKNYDLVGEGMALYYNVAARWWFEHPNMRHASLCQTVARRSVFPFIQRECLSKSPFLDTQLWAVVRRKLVFPPVRDRRLLVGMKSMPGRLGYGTGHKAVGGKGTHWDHDLTKLKALMGPDAEHYASYYHPVTLPAKAIAP